MQMSQCDQRGRNYSGKEENLDFSRHSLSDELKVTTDLRLFVDFIDLQSFPKMKEQPDILFAKK